MGLDRGRYTEALAERVAFIAVWRFAVLEVLYIPDSSARIIRQVVGRIVGLEDAQRGEDCADLAIVEPRGNIWFIHLFTF